MEEILEQARSIYEGEIDFEGQKLVERLSTGLLILTGAVAFLVGYITGDIRQILYSGLGGTALTFLVTVPPWPFFNQSPQPFLPPKTGRGSLQGINVGDLKIG